jgi:hypothetical protein
MIIPEAGSKPLEVRGRYEFERGAEEKVIELGFIIDWTTSANEKASIFADMRGSE